jgi:phthiocerol/phenolphthiocerol synthesis type-I polyketide synthase C
VHAAGVVEFRAVEELTPDELAAVLRPKVAGGWALHRVFRDVPLDFFVLFSSGSAVLGSPMLAGYAAANAFLDGLAHHRRAAGLPALSVDWGYWTGTGIVERFATEHGRSLIPKGMAGFTAEEGVDALRTLLGGHTTQALVLPVDWERWRAAHPQAAKAPLLRELFTGTTPSRPEGSPPVPDATEPRPEHPPAEAPGRTGDGLGGRTPEEYLLGQVATVLGLPASRVNTRRSLTAQGIDSLMAVELRTRVGRDLGVQLPVARILGQRTLSQLAADLADALRSTYLGRNEKS